MPTTTEENDPELQDLRKLANARAITFQTRFGFESFSNLSTASLTRLLVSKGLITHKEIFKNFHEDLDNFYNQSKILENVYRRERKRFEADATAARALVQGIKGWTPPTGADVKELAAWFFVTTILLNLDETITKG